MSKIRNGFTLIELLVVITIIVILSSVLLVSLSSSRSKARDAKRVSDISQIQLALEQYFDRCQQYPLPGPTQSIVVTSASNCAVTTVPPITLANYITQIPKPPTGAGPSDYAYYVNNPSGKPTDYVLQAILEKPSDSLADSLPESKRPSWVPAGSCYAGVSTSLKYCVGPK